MIRQQKPLIRLPTQNLCATAYDKRGNIKKVIEKVSKGTRCDKKKLSLFEDPPRDGRVGYATIAPRDISRGSFRQNNQSAKHDQDSQITVGENRGESEARTAQGFLGVERTAGAPYLGEWVHIEHQLQKGGLAKGTMWINHKHSRSHLAHVGTGGSGESMTVFLRGCCWTLPQTGRGWTRRGGASGGI